MSFLRVFLIIQAVFAVLMVCPVTIKAGFREQGYARIGYLFFHYTIAPRPPIPQKPKKKPEAEKPEKNHVQELFQEKGLSGFLKILDKAAKIASGTAKTIFAHLVFDHFWLKIDVGGKNASQTAMDYGYVCGAAGSAVNLLLGNAKCRSSRIRIAPDFRSQQSTVAFDMKAHITTLFLIGALLKALFRSIKLLKLIKSQKAIHNN